MRASIVVFCLLGLTSVTTWGQVTADTTYVPPDFAPSYAEGCGPTVLVDEAHRNYHTDAGRFAPFASLLRADGFRVAPGTGSLSAGSLREADLVVIANPRPAEGRTPSAFSDEEIEAVARWVGAGGALLLIADHMPFPAAAAPLAARFGFELMDGFAMDPDGSDGWTVFARAHGTLADHPVTTGHGLGRIDSVASFTGQAFPAPKEATSLLTLPSGYVVLFPRIPWRFDASTPYRRAAGWSQGAVMEFGEGRVAVFGEAAMFTAQRAPSGSPAGFGHPAASDNERFVLSLVRWLTAAVE